MAAWCVFLAKVSMMKPGRMMEDRLKNDERQWGKNTLFRTENRTHCHQSVITACKFYL